MSYRLERSEPVPEGLKRIVREELDSARAHMAAETKVSRDEAIHEARKSIKKVRAILRFVRPELGRKLYEKEDTRMGDTARKLSESRDAAVMIEVLDYLRRECSDEEQKEMSAIRHEFVKRKDASARQKEITEALKDTVSTLQILSKDAAEWPLQAEGFAALEPGLKAVYRDGRKALALAQKRSAADIWHSARKRIKEQWYAVRLLESLWTDVMSAYEKSLKDLETWLGDDHNLVVLRQTLKSDPAFHGERKKLKFVFRLIDKKQKELRANSTALGQRIYEEKPGQFILRMKGLWEAWQKEPKSLEKVESVKRKATKKKRNPATRTSRSAA